MSSRLRVLGIAAALLLVATMPARADIITAAAFTAPTLIDFNDIAAGDDSAIDDRYASLGVTFTNLCGGQTYDTGSGVSDVGTNFYCAGYSTTTGYPSVTAQFSSTMTRTGFSIITNDPDDLRVYAYLGSTLVGSEFFNTNINGSFVGVEFLTGFDRLVLDATNASNGAFALDNFRFESTAPVPEPTTMSLFAVGLVGAAARRLRKRGGSVTA